MTQTYAPALTGTDLDLAWRLLRRVKEDLDCAGAAILGVGAGLRDDPAALADLAADIFAGEDDGTWPYCAACGEWAGMFQGLEGWHHFRGNPAPGGHRDMYDPGHPITVAWCTPPGRPVSPAGCERLLAALGDAIAFRGTGTAQADGYQQLAAELRAAHALAITPGPGDEPPSPGEPW